ncbi:nuclease [Rhodopseudomonas palustris]|uniref:Nuclease n=1 Tax=Rhodopseudomonas palustris TaxID=1076 RepID=A0A0D7EHJ0_RHOPL|nr:nuclease [Rhodopseudomonas palustris]
MFVVGVAAGTMLPARHWPDWRGALTGTAHPSRSADDSDAIWRRAGNPGIRHPVEVLRTIDGDTFEARVHLWPGLDMTTRVRLRGIDAPELKAHCARELQGAEAASAALRGLLDQGEVTIFNIGPDKYQGRVVADAATKQTPNVSDALLAGGFARAYHGGHRDGWCR